MTAERPDPGFYVRKHLEARGWKPVNLVEFLQRPLREIEEIVAGHREITPQVASGLAKAFGTTPQYWLNHQMAWDLLQTARDD
jgi:HTH-type transcriptional regulator / antitoxin HigA